MSMSGAGFIAEGPIGDGSTFLMSVRRSYLDLVFRSTGFTAIPKYSNINFKSAHTLSKNDFMNVLFLQGWDGIHIQQDPNGTNAENVSADVDMNGWQRVVGANWKHIYSSGVYSVLQIWNTDNVYRNVVSDLVIEPRGIISEGNSIESQSATQYELYSLLNKNIALTIGLGWRNIELDYNMFRRDDKNGFGDHMQSETTDTEKAFMKGNAYVTAAISLQKDFRLSLGLRWNHHSVLKQKNSFDPRIGLSYSIGPLMTVNASYGLYHQSPEAVWIFGGERENTGLSFVEARQSVFGFEFFPSDGMKISMEGYVKQYAKYPVSMVYPQFTLANAGDGFGTVAVSDLVSEGNGNSVGIDCFIQQKMTDNIYGLISYSYSKTRHSGLDRISRDGSFDIPHVFTISGGYKLTPQWEISSKYRFVSGRPYPRIDETASHANAAIMYDINNINTERYPDYWRWDIRVDYRTHFEHFSLVTYLDIQNVLNKKNIWGYSWDRVHNKKVDIVQYGFFPVGGLKLEF